MGARDTGEPHRAATPLELFFDLCFVVAVARAAELLHHDVAVGHAGARRRRVRDGVLRDLVGVDERHLVRVRVRHRRRRHYFIFASAAAVGAGIAVGVDEVAGKAHLSHVAAGYALAVPVTVYLTAVWLLHVRPHQRGPVTVALAAAALVAVTVVAGRRVADRLADAR